MKGLIRMALIKKLKILFLCSLSFLFYTPFVYGKMEVPNPGAFQPLPMPTAEELEEIEKILSELSDEDIEALAKMGEEIIQASKDAGLESPWAMPDPGKPAPTPEKPQPDPVAPSKKDPEPKKPKKNAPKKASLLAHSKMLKNSINRIDSIRQKVASDLVLQDSLSPLDKPLNNLLYYLHVINDEKMIGYLELPEFKELLYLLVSFESGLELLDEQLEVPEHMSTSVSKEKEDKTSCALSQAKKVLRYIIDFLKEAFEKDALNEKLEELIGKYEPEALKIKKEMEQKEKEALDYARNLSNQKASTTAPINYNYPGGRAPMRPGQPNYQRGYSPSSARGTTPSAAKNTKGNSTTKGKPSKTTDKKPEPPKKIPPPTIAEIESGIIKQLDKIEGYFAPKEKEFTDFISNYHHNKNASQDINTIFSSANFDFKKTRETIGKWHKDATIKSKSSSEFAEKIKNMKTMYENSAQHRNIKNIHSLIKDQITKNNVTLEGEVKRFRDNMDDVEKKLTGAI